jgi:hypothetical protein
LIWVTAAFTLSASVSLPVILKFNWLIVKFLVSVGLTLPYCLGCYVVNDLLPKELTSASRGT